MKEEMIGYCGYSCHLCSARSDDPAVRQKLVDGWRRIFGHQQYTAENVKCDGCLMWKPELITPLFPHCFLGSEGIK